MTTGNTPITGFANTGGQGLLTLYTYTPRGELHTVTQGSLLPRTFTYNSLGWLLSANNPETGVIGYDYFSDGSLKKKTDARGAQINYMIDAWNRVYRKTYVEGSAEATSTVDYKFDAHTGTPLGTSYPKGRLTEMAVTGGPVVRYDQIDPLGRVLAHTQSTVSV